MICNQHSVKRTASTIMTTTTDASTTFQYMNRTNQELERTYQPFVDKEGKTELREVYEFKQPRKPWTYNVVNGRGDSLYAGPIPYAAFLRKEQGLRDEEEEYERRFFNDDENGEYDDEYDEYDE